MYRELLIDQNMEVIEAMRILDQTAKRILVVIDVLNCLCGVITDGDIRRHIIAGKALNSPVSDVMNRNPITVKENDRSLFSFTDLDDYILAIPVINEFNSVVDILIRNDVKINLLTEDIPVVIMAGGKGTRLYPYTRILPKALVPIGEIPILERIIDQFNSVGCHKFYISVNHKKNMIKSYFSELDKKYHMHYVEEHKPLGTAGSLSLLENDLNGTFFMSNCDILINGDFVEMLNFHRSNNCELTVITSLKSEIIPYGVIKLNDEGMIAEIEEKPTFNFMVNTGVYICEASIFKWIPKECTFNMNQLIEKLIHKGMRVGTYPISDEAWMDMGQLSEMERMIDKLKL